MIRFKRTATTVETSQTIAGTYPKTIVLVFGHRTYIVIRQDARGISVVAVGFEAVAIERAQALIGTYPHHAIVVEHKLSCLLDALNRCLRHNSERHGACHGHLPKHKNSYQ